MCINKKQIFDIPDSISFEEAAALPEALSTLWLNMYKLGGIKSGMKFLIHAGTSGIGSFAIQIAKAEGCTVYTTVGDSGEKMKFCKELGSEDIFNYNEKNFGEKIKELGSVDLIIDILGGGYTNQNLKALRKGGKLISIATMDSPSAEVNLASVLMKNITIIGSTLRSKSSDEKGEILQSAVAKLLPFIMSDKIKPVIDSIYDFEDAEKAHERMKSRKHKGKIVLKVNDNLNR